MECGKKFLVFKCCFWIKKAKILDSLMENGSYNVMGVFGTGDMPRDFKKSDKHLKRRNNVIPSP